MIMLLFLFFMAVTRYTPVCLNVTGANEVYMRYLMAELLIEVLCAFSILFGILASH